MEYHIYILYMFQKLAVECWDLSIVNVLNPNKRCVWLNKSISLLTPQYTTFTQSSLSHSRKVKVKKVVTHYPSVRGTQGWVTQQYKPNSIKSYQKIIYDIRYGAGFQSILKIFQPCRGKTFVKVIDQHVYVRLFNTVQGHLRVFHKQGFPICNFPTNILP